MNTAGSASDKELLLDANGIRHTPAKPDARIVCLVPSITELLCDLGLSGQVVGRTGFCVHPAETVRRVTKCGGTKDVKLDVVRELSPTHVIVNIDENTRETYNALCEFVPNVIVTHPNAPEDNLALYALLGGIFGRESAANQLAARLQAGLDAIAALPALPLRRTLYMIWREPWMCVSPDTYISRTLALLNWQTVPIAPKARYPTLQPEEIAALNPDLVLLSSEPYPFRDTHVAELASLVPRAEVRLINGEMTSWYGSRAIAGLAYLRNLAQDLAHSQP